jgi:hypothetical protein
MPVGMALAALPAGADTLAVPAPPPFASDDDGDSSEHAANSNSAAAQVMRSRVIAILASRADATICAAAPRHFVTWLFWCAQSFAKAFA